MLLFYEPVLKKLFTKSFRSYSELGLICLMSAAEQGKKKKSQQMEDHTTRITFYNTFCTYRLLQLADNASWFQLIFTC